MTLQGKKISILGAVRSGIGAAKLVKRIGGIPFVSDLSPREILSDSISILENEQIDFEVGGHTAKVFECDFVITSPGVPSDSAIINEFRKRNIEIISEVEFAAQHCNANIISITGTNGKTTTTSLMNFTLNTSGIRSSAAGNIGKAFSEVVDQLDKDDYVSLETSSFQLDHIKFFKPKFSLILNITPDHLDRYNNSFESYIASKIVITKNQNKDDYFIYNADDPNTFSSLNNNAVNKYAFSIKNKIDNGAYLENGTLVFSKNGIEESVCSTNDLFIKGEHNIANALAVLVVAKLIGISNELIKKSFSEFKGVEHRLEFVRELNGITYINDSKATNVDSVWYALRSFDRPIYLILGGKDKGNNYDQIRELVEKNVIKIYAIGSSAQKVYEYFHSLKPVEIKNSLEECVETATRDAEKNSILLLSPACASFDMFQNYEHRGEVFKEAVLKLQ
jgi:UDP-N-acetylmuramoylalanine--D-glutamate ligase